MPESPHLSAIFPELYKKPNPIIEPNSPLIVTGSLLHLEEVQMLAIDGGMEPRIDPNTKIRMYGAIGGLSVLSKVRMTNPKDYSKLLWTPCKEIPVWVGAVSYEDSLDELLGVVDLTRFGDAIVEKGNATALLTLSEIIQLFRSGVIKSNLRVSEVGSVIFSISSDADLLDALKLMFEKRIRRVFLESQKQRSRPCYLSSRSIIRFLFSPQRLEIAKQNPEEWAQAKVRDLQFRESKVIFDGKTINQAAQELGNSVDDCLVCEESQKVVTRWDLVMKPWKSREYSFGWGS